MLEREDKMKFLLKTGAARRRLRLRKANNTYLLNKLYADSGFASRPAVMGANIANPVGIYYDAYINTGKRKRVIGQVGFEDTGDAYWLQYGIDSRYRRRGYGERAAKAAIKKLLASSPSKPVCATVDERNIPSLRLLEKLGFKPFPPELDEKAREQGLLEKNEKRYLLPASFFTLKQGALGIPDRSEYGNLANLASLVGKMTPYVAQKHLAERAGPHIDFRIQGPEGLYSWALPKGFPELPGKSRLAIQQSLHSPWYIGFTGEIPEGYGKGSVGIARAGKALITDIQYDDKGRVKRLNFSLDRAGTPERFSLVRKGKPKQWYLVNVTPTVGPEELGFEKPHYPFVKDEKELEELLSKVNKDRPMSAKIDGALNLLHFLKDKANILSYRVSVGGGPIYHTERVAPELLRKRSIPPELQNVVFSGELYALEKGKPLSVSELGGLLNSTLSRARENITKRKIEMHMALLDVISKNKKLSRAEKQKLMDKAIAAFPKFLTKPEEAATVEEARKLLEKIVKGEHPITREGVIFSLPGGAKKWKPWSEADVIIRKITPGTGRFEGRGAGAIWYSLTPNGPIVGKVGTGLTDDQRIWLWKNRDKLKNKVAVIKYLEQLPSGAYRGPVFLGIHPSYPTYKGKKLYWGSDIESRMAKHNGKKTKNK